eukprot:2689970-Prymnesium_polylepis.2
MPVTAVAFRLSSGLGGVYVSQASGTESVASHQRHPPHIAAMRAVCTVILVSCSFHARRSAVQIRSYDTLPETPCNALPVASSTLYFVIPDRPLNECQVHPEARQPLGAAGMTAALHVFKDTLRCLALAHEEDAVVEQQPLAWRWILKVLEGRRHCVESSVLKATAVRRLLAIPANDEVCIAIREHRTERREATQDENIKVKGHHPREGWPPDQTSVEQRPHDRESRVDGLVSHWHPAGYAAGDVRVRIGVPLAIALNLVASVLWCSRVHVRHQRD